MNNHRFDNLARDTALRGSRRQILAGMMGLTAAAVATRTVAQEATPAASPVSADVSENTEFLFVQHFEGGSWLPKEGEEGTYILTLTGAAASTTFFSDRPDRIVGIAPTQQFLDGLGFTPANPPNAALVAHTEEGDQESLLIELYSPVFDPETETLTYDAHILSDYGEHSFVHLEQPPSDTHLPETLGDGSLFIDDCSNGYGRCVAADGSAVGGLNGVPCCWKTSKFMCIPCSNHEDFIYAEKCAKQYPTQCGDYSCSSKGLVC